MLIHMEAQVIRLQFYSVMKKLKWLFLSFPWVCEPPLNHHLCLLMLWSMINPGSIFNVQKTSQNHWHMAWAATFLLPIQSNFTITTQKSKSQWKMLNPDDFPERSVFWFEIQLICFDRACVGPAREQQQNQNKRSELNVKFLDHWKTLLNPIFLWNQTNFQASANGTGLKEVT